MLKLCFGTFFKILYQAKQCKNQEILFEALVGPMFTNDYEYDSDKGTIDTYKKGGLLSSTLIATAQVTTAESLVDKYKSSLLGKLKSDKFGNIVLAIKDLLKKDSIPNNTIIGTDTQFTKYTILESNNFSLADLLANVAIYCLRKTNDICSKDLEADYLSSFDADAATIYFNDSPLRVETPLDYTAKNEMFLKTFTEITHTATLPTPNKSTIKLFSLGYSGRKFNHQSIGRFIKSNLDRYVFSRIERKKKIEDDEESMLLFDAVQEIKRIYPKLDLGDHFADIMLYSFLECSINAPKIFSKIELTKQSGNYRSESSNIHFLAKTDIPLSNNQIILGTSTIKNDILGAVDSAISQIKTIDDNSDNEVNLIEKGILDSTFGRETVNYLKRAIIPTRASIPTPDISYGIFIGYSVDSSGLETLSNSDFQNELTSRMAADIKGVASTIHSKINSLGLTGHSFYLFFFPLIDAENEKSQIMSGSIGGEKI